MIRVVIAGLVAIHLAAALWHGNAHTTLDVALSPWQNAFVFLVILIAPIVAAALVWTRYGAIGVWMFFLSMVGALVFGAYYHYVLVSPDNIAHLPSHGAEAHATFIASAGTLAVLELTSSLYGAFCLGLTRGRSIPGPRIR
jgi:hypothetical protein